MRRTTCDVGGSARRSARHRLGYARQPPAPTRQPSRPPPPTPRTHPPTTCQPPANTLTTRRRARGDIHAKRSRYGSRAWAASPNRHSSAPRTRRHCLAQGQRDCWTAAHTQLARRPESGPGVLVVMEGSDSGRQGGAISASSSHSTRGTTRSTLPSDIEEKNLTSCAVMVRGTGWAASPCSTRSGTAGVVHGSGLRHQNSGAGHTDESFSSSETSCLGRDSGQVLVQISPTSSSPVRSAR